MAGSGLSAEIAEVAAYTKSHPELRSAHHFLYDLRCPPKGAPTYVVMGINPGERDLDWQIAPDPTEETSRYDFHTAMGPGRDDIRWVKQARYFLDDADYVQTELFFWSSKDLDEFKVRFGALSRSPHLPFCTRMNRALIEAYAPKAVIFPGLSCLPMCSRFYGLRHLRSFAADGVRLVEHCTDGRRPWLFTKHWTGSRGFSNAQRERIRDYIRGVE